MDKGLESMFTRAEKLLGELEKEYNSCLHAKNVTEEAKHLTHEVLEKLKNALNHTMAKAWEKIIAPDLSAADKKKRDISFPTSNSLQSFGSTLGRAKMTGSDKTHKNLYDFLLSKQPFSSSDNQWLGLLSKISGEGKHIRLIPQKRFETRRITVTKPGSGRVTYDPSKTKFKSRGTAKIFGAEVDPKTQRIKPTAGVTEKIEIWVSFGLEGYKINALGFCKEVCQKTRNLVEEIVDTFEL